jgi:hypothetical protein
MSSGKILLLVVFKRTYSNLLKYIPKQVRIKINNKPEWENGFLILKNIGDYVKT